MNMFIYMNILKCKCDYVSVGKWYVEWSWCLSKFIIMFVCVNKCEYMSKLTTSILVLVSACLNILICVSKCMNDFIYLRCVNEYLSIFMNIMYTSRLVWVYLCVKVKVWAYIYMYILVHPSVSKFVSRFM